jgi:hypothetical protein
VIFGSGRPGNRTKGKFQGFFGSIGNGEIWDREKGTGRMGKFW